MQNQEHLSTFWKRLFHRRSTHERPTVNSSVETYFVFLYGKRRKKLLTVETLQEFETAFEQGVRKSDEISLQSFQSCVSWFEEEQNSIQFPLCVPIADQTFGHYISKSRLGKIAREILKKMHTHLSDSFSDQEDNGEKYLTPGIGWQVRDDETGVGLMSPSRFDSFEGMWRRDFEYSDEASLMVDVMEMPWIYKKATHLIHYTKVVVVKEAIHMYAKALGLSFPTISYWTREGKMRPRRDSRKGVARVTTVPTTFGFRQYLQWGQPLAGFALAEAQLSFDNNSFQIVNWIQRYDGPSCSIRSVLRRHQ